jgi:uncharacterized membrane protein YdjX (TVP38/TMEM64 family)
VRRSQHAVVPFPSELVNAAAGFVYGFWIAFPLALFGWLLAAVGSFLVLLVGGRVLAQRVRRRGPA